MPSTHSKITRRFEESQLHRKKSIYICLNMQSLKVEAHCYRVRLQTNKSFHYITWGLGECSEKVPSVNLSKTICGGKGSGGDSFGGGTPQTERRGTQLPPLKEVQAPAYIRGGGPDHPKTEPRQGCFHPRIQHGKPFTCLPATKVTIFARSFGLISLPSWAEQLTLSLYSCFIFYFLYF